MGVRRGCMFFFNDTATTEIYTLSLHDALPISGDEEEAKELVPIVREALRSQPSELDASYLIGFPAVSHDISEGSAHDLDRKSTRLNSSHANISYAVFCLKKKKSSPACSTNATL